MTVIDSLDARKLHFVDVDGIRTRYYEDGVGESLVLLHGGQYSSYYSLDSWSLNLPALAERFHVYAVDKLGQGYTDNPATEQDYTFDALFRHTVGWLRAVGIRSAHLAGHSRGAFLATRLAQEHPDLARTLTIVDSDSTAPNDPTHQSGVFYDRLEAQTPKGPPTAESVRIEPDAQAYSREQVTDDFVARMLEIARSPTTRESRRLMRDLKDRVWLPSLARAKEDTLRRIAAEGLPCPTQIIWGFDDRSAPRRLALALYERICARTPRAELHLLNQAGHYSFREQPVAFNGLMRAFCLG
jgi:pimeloyl-ACP methyl ester carboxylesterase